MDSLALGPGQLRRVGKPARGRPQGVTAGLVLTAGDPVELLRRPADGPDPAPKRLAQDDPARQPHEYLPDGTAKTLTLFRPADGHVRVRGVTTCPNAVLHPWLKQERWQDGLTIEPTLLAELSPLQMLLVLDNLAGHKTPESVCWLL